MPFQLPATLAVSGSDSLVYDLFTVLASATLVAILIQRMRLAVIPGYLITGALVGPGALGLVKSPESLSLISHLAVILLMFGIGLHLDFASLRRGLGTKIAVGVGSCLLSIAVGFPVVRCFGLTAPAALVVAMALSLSSTAVVLRIIAQRRDLRRPSGRLSFAVLIVQDLLVVGMLVALPVIGRWGEGGGQGMAAVPAWSRVLVDAVFSLIGVTGLVILGKLVLPRLVHETARGKAPEVMMILSVAVAIGAAVVTKVLGFSPEMGAFLAGFLLASTHFRHELRGQIGPLRDLFMAVFFTAVGMNLDLATLAEWWWLVILGTVLLCVLKAACIGLSAWSFGTSGSIAIIVGLSLSQAGEFSLVLLERASSIGILSQTVVANAIAIVVMSLIFTPSQVMGGFYLARRLSWLRPAPWIRSTRNEAPVDDPDQEDGKHVIIAGYGTIGRALDNALEQIGVPVVIAELNAETVRDQARKGRTIIYGDVGDPEVLESLGVHRAAALVLTIPDEEAVLRACQMARRLVPELYIAVRTSFPTMGMRAAELGANHVTVEEFAAADDLCRAVLGYLSLEVTATVGRPVSPKPTPSEVDEPDALEPGGELETVDTGS